MEHLNQEERYIPTTTEASIEQDTILEGGELFIESREAYANDLSHIEQALAHKHSVLTELEQTAAVHASVPINAFDVLRSDLEGKISKMKTDIERLETLRRVTEQRLATTDDVSAKQE